MKLSKEQIESKLSFHKKRAKFYKKKLKDIKQNDKRIGFKHYD